jgi:hypothetical protein
MKKNLLLVLFCLCSVLAFNVNSNAQGTLIYYWTFNNYVPMYTTPTPGVSIYADIPADYAATGLDTNNAIFMDRTIPGTSSSFSSYCDVTTDLTDTLNQRVIGGSLTVPGNCFRARNPDDSLELLLYMPTTGYKNLELKYGCELSSYTSGDSINVFSYSNDSGTTWISSGSGLSEWLDSGSVSFRLISLHINDTNAYNNSKFVFRINLVGRNSSTGGNNRFDNFSLDGDPVSPLGINNLATTAKYSLYPNPVLNNLEISAINEGAKSIVITNALGEKVYETKANGNAISINTIGFNAGMYFISIAEIATGEISTMKFIKK